ncbi:MAG: PIN domain-containing protein [Dehalococcoidia bacterium]|nr:PIN domain-containing protein [Dehalococcoidia bacterium]MYA52816.1 PIN domain-containing protein [Dehalococcoidia bacterium]
MAQQSGRVASRRCPGFPATVPRSARKFVVQSRRVYRTLLEPLWQAAQDGAVTIVSSPILIVEALVKPFRDGNTEIEMQYRELFEANAVRFLDASRPVFEDAARLRAVARLTTPDAIHAATALRAGCSLFVTNDADFRKGKRPPRHHSGRSHLSPIKRSLEARLPGCS